MRYPGLLRGLLPMLALTAGAAPCAADGPGPIEVPPIEGVKDFEGLGARWESMLQTFQVPGMTVAVVRDGKLVAVEGFGTRDDQGRPPDGDTMYYIASITKTFTAAAVAKLAEEGKLDLEAPVKRYLPRFEVAGEEATGSITVRDLLCHRPGLSGRIPTLDAYTGEITEDRFYTHLAVIEPAGRVAYSNVHFTVLGRVIEAVTGETWKNWVEGHLCRPGGMMRTTASATRLYGDDNGAVGLEWRDGAWVRAIPAKTDRTMHAAGGMGASANDLARWILINMGEAGAADGGPGVLSERTREQMLSLQGALDEPDGRIRRMEGFGFGWGVGTYRGRPYRAHEGGFTGAAAHVSFLPEQRCGVVVLTNGSPGGGAVATLVSIDLYDRMLGESGHPDLLPVYAKSAPQILARAAANRHDPQAAKALASPMDAYVGRYGHPDWGTIVVSEDAGGLSAQMGDLPLNITGAEGQMLRTNSAAGEFELRFEVESGKANRLTWHTEGREDVVFVRE